MIAHPKRTRVRSLHPGSKSELGTIIDFVPSSPFPYIIHWDAIGEECCEELEFELVGTVTAHARSRYAEPGQCGSVTDSGAGDTWCCQPKGHSGPCKLA